MRRQKQISDSAVFSAFFNSHDMYSQFFQWNANTIALKSLVGLYLSGKEELTLFNINFFVEEVHYYFFFFAFSDVFQLQMEKKDGFGPHPLTNSTDIP